MACYKNGGCGVYENRSCYECPASKPEYSNRDKHMKNNCDSLVIGYIKALEDMGYTHEKSVTLAKFIAHVRTINPSIGFCELIEAMETLGFRPGDKE